MARVTLSGGVTKAVVGILLELVGSGGCRLNVGSWFCLAALIAIGLRTSPCAVQSGLLTIALSHIREGRTVSSGNC